MIVLEKKMRKVKCRQRIIEHKRIKVEVTGEWRMGERNNGRMEMEKRTGKGMKRQKSVGGKKREGSVYHGRRKVIS